MITPSRKREGFTPLLRLAKNNSDSEGWDYGRDNSFLLGYANYVSAFLEAGADKSLTVEIDGQRKTAQEINTDSAVREILERN